MPDVRDWWQGLSRWARGFVFLIALVAGAAALYLWAPAVGTPSRAALSYSLAMVSGGSTLGVDETDCRERSEGILECWTADSHGSGSARYRVTMDGERCWRATKLTPDANEEPPALQRSPTGCVKLHDQARLLHRLLD
jgi:hypothetical protein